jgi:hypothetical protein
MQAGAISLWKRAKIRLARQILVPVLVPVGVGIRSILVRRGALWALLASVDIKHVMRRNASLCVAVQKAKNQTHNPLVGGSNPSGPTMQE